MKVTVDGATCVGCGLCEQGCPEIFQVQGDGIAHILTQNCSLSHNLKEIADSCPVNCIRVA
ncbi:MAG: hypothetical protein A3G37_00220 [Omnitrophica WOR_2 bacterium RIFCSPLOWO2_12_FULL_46_30]|nr:MAG: hypothetical protein A3H41_04275 [Omnitrophica WOR_2 bacterium RIFCSPLOWO2_02_FULL_45_28]OGX51862.1 MAG: hypothetical protein A3G37_00220 [Omnitrophica WOR_2 bacterium RIFCSPLOWO2_12_FULL_46_30]